MKTSICATGDSIMMNPLPPDYKGFEQLRNFIGNADVRTNNLEMVLSDYDCFASSFCGGTWLTGPTEMLDKIMEFGFNYFSIANNHTMDYSYDGLASTLRVLEKKKVAYSGAGNDLSQASKPAVLKTNSGTVGLISICATNDDAARAGTKGKVFPGRPGLNPLRHNEVYHVNASHLQALKEIASNTCINGRIDNSKKGGYTPEKPGLFSLGTIDFMEDEKEGKASFPNKIDMERTERGIRDARADVDYVVVLVHSHEIKGLTDDEPDYFLEEFCHRCIDSGAAAVIGGGTHQLKAVELYKNCPIFYSIGNFIFQTESMHHMPTDYYEKYGIPLEYTAQEALAVRSANHTRGLHCDYRNFRSIMPFMEFEDGTLTRLVLAPLELGFEAPRHLEGYPSLADENVSREILDRLTVLSGPYGTKLAMENGLISVELS